MYKVEKDGMTNEVESKVQLEAFINSGWKQLKEENVVVENVAEDKKSGRSIRESSGTLGDSLESLLMSSRAVSMWRLGAIPIMGRDVYAKAVKEK